MDCLFCKIGSGEVPTASLYEDEHVVAFLDVMPRAPGHTLVIPKSHAASLIELPDGEVGPVFAAVKKMDMLLTEALKPAGMTIGINQGEISGQSVPHLHVHLMPRFAGDKGGSIHSVVNNQPTISAEEMVEKIKSHIS